MPDIQIGDLVKYNYKDPTAPEARGVWLVVNVETDIAFGHFGERVTLKQGNEQRLTYHFYLDKISSSR